MESSWKNTIAMLFMLSFSPLTVPQAFADEAMGAPSSKHTIELVPRVGHSFGVDRLVFAAGGELLVSAGGEGTVKVWSTVDHRLIRTIVTGAGVSDLSISPDGRAVATAGVDGNVKVWDLLSGELRRTLSSHVGRARAVAYFPKGNRLVSGGQDGTLHISDAKSGKLLTTVAAHDKAVMTIAVSPDGDRVATGGADHIVKIWDTKRRFVKSHELLDHHEDVWRVAFSPDGRTLLSAGGRLNFIANQPVDSALRLWDVRSGRLVAKFDSDTRKATRDAAFSGDGMTIFAVGGQDSAGLGVVRAWSVDTKLELGGLNGDPYEEGISLAISPDNAIVACGEIFEIRDWTLNDARTRGAYGGINSRRSSALAASKSGSKLILAAGDSLAVRSLNDGSLERFIRGKSTADPISEIALSPSDDAVVARTDRGAMAMWDLDSGRQRWNVPQTRHQSQFSPGAHLSFSSDGRLILLVGDDDAMTIWDSSSGALLNRYLLPNTNLIAATLSSDSAQITSVSSDGVLRRFEVAAREARAEISIVPAPDHLLAAGFSAEHSTVAIVRVDKEYKQSRLQLIDCASGRILLDKEDAGLRRTSVVSFAPNGKEVATGGFDNEIRLWDLSDGHQIATLSGHTGNIKQLVFVRSGAQIVSSSDDGTAGVWVLSHLRRVATLMTDLDGEYLTITPDGFFAGSSHSAQMITAVRGLRAYSMDQLYGALYRPDLVAESLAGDIKGIYAQAVALMNLSNILESGPPPQIELLEKQTDLGQNSVRVAVRIKDSGGGIGPKLVFRVNGHTQGPLLMSGLAGRPYPGRSVRVTQGLSVDLSKTNSIEVVAYNFKGVVASSPLLLTVDWAGVATAPRPRLWILSIGVDKYEMKDYKLHFAVKDAQTFADKAAEIASSLFDEIKVHRLLDSDANKDRIDATMHELASKIRPTDVFLMFVAGHGQSLDGRYYFVQQNFDTGKNQSVKTDAIGQDLWQSWLAEIHAQNKLMIFDTCESATATSLARGNVLARRAAMDQLQRATGDNVIAAARQAAHEGYQGHGVLTYTILEDFQRPNGAVGEEKVDLNGLAKHIGDRVPMITSAVFGESQEPVQKLSGNNFPLGFRVADALPPADCTGGEDFVVTQDENLLNTIDR
jgi:WD40 repeat protein